MATVSLADMVADRCNPQALSESLAQAARKIHASETLDYSHVKRRLAWFQRQSLAFGSDVTWGYAKVLADLVGVQAVGLEDPLESGMTADALLASSHDFIRRRMANREALRASDLFKAWDDKVRAMFLQVNREDDTVNATNERWDNLFGKAGHTNFECLARGCTAELQMGGFFATDDQGAVFEIGVQVLLGQSHGSWTILAKLFDTIQGMPLLYILKGHSLCDEKGRELRLLYLEPAPASRYVSCVPRERRKLITAFRERKRGMVEGPSSRVLRVSSEHVRKNGFDEDDRERKRKKEDKAKVRDPGRGPREGQADPRTAQERQLVDSVVAISSTEADSGSLSSTSSFRPSFSLVSYPHFSAFVGDEIGATLRGYLLQQNPERIAHLFGMPLWVKPKKAALPFSTETAGEQKDGGGKLANELGIATEASCSTSPRDSTAPSVPSQVGRSPPASICECEGEMKDAIKQEPEASPSYITSEGRESRAESLSFSPHLFPVPVLADEMDLSSLFGKYEG